MIEITFNAFSILRKKITDKRVNYAAPMEIPKEMSVNELATYIGLDKDDVEAVFINHKLVSKETIIKNGDRVSLVPPGGIPKHVAAYVGGYKDNISAK